MVQNCMGYRVLTRFSAMISYFQNAVVGRFIDIPPELQAESKKKRLFMVDFCSGGLYGGESTDKGGLPDKCDIDVSVCKRVV